MPGCRILALERRHQVSRYVGLAGDGPARQTLHGKTMFSEIDFPVAATFEHPAQLEQCWKDRMSVPPPAEVTDLGPWIGVKKIVLIEPHAGVS